MSLLQKSFTIHSDLRARLNMEKAGSPVTSCVTSIKSGSLHFSSSMGSVEKVSSIMRPWHRSWQGSLENLIHVWHCTRVNFIENGPVNIELILLVLVHEHSPCLEDRQRLGVSMVEQIFVILFWHWCLHLDDLKFMIEWYYFKYNLYVDVNTWDLPGLYFLAFALSWCKSIGHHRGCHAS